MSASTSQGSRTAPAAPPGPSPAFFEGLRRGGRCTQLVTTHRPWDPEAPSLRATREAARRGLRIERTFLVAHRFQREDPRLVEQQKLDREAGLVTRVLHAGPRIAALHETAPGGFEFGLWDDAVCGSFVTGDGAAARRIVAWRTSREPALLARARAFLARLDADVAPAEAQPPDGLPEEPLLPFVPVVSALAEGCRVDPETGRSCAGYHRPHAWWRALGLLPGAYAHRALFERGLAPLLRRGAPLRILVSGSADFSLCALLVWIARSAGVEPEITVIDWCPTPLGGARWYAERVGARLHTIVGDVKSFQCDRPFDAVCTHFFLGWIPLERRADLIRSWARVLRPGGRVVTNAGIPGGPRASRERTTLASRFAPGQLETFRELAVERAHAFKDVLGLDVDEVAAAAEVFLPNWRSRFPSLSVEDLATWFEDAGFDLACEVRDRVPRSRDDWNPAPALEVARHRREAWLVATRR